MLDFAFGGIARDAEVAREHAFHIAVQDGRALAIGERGNGRGGGAADAGQRGDGLGRGRKASVPVARNLLRATVQVPGAGVIAQAGPVRHHVFLGGRRQRRHVREALQEAVVIGDDSGHLSLLQHDLG
ncbi:hypothetical protein D3C71_1555430 [compost metagenome]